MRPSHAKAIIAILVVPIIVFICAALAAASDTVGRARMRHVSSVLYAASDAGIVDTAADTGPADTGASDSGVADTGFANTRSINCEGTDDYVNHTDVATLDGLQKGTFSLWFRSTAGAWPSGEQGIFSKYYNSKQFGIFSFTTGTIRVYISATTGDSTNRWKSANSAFAINTWYHVVVVFDGSGADNATRLFVYRNGSDITAAGAFTGTIPATFTTGGTDPITTCAWGNPSNYWTGWVDEIAVWPNLAMTPTQVSEVYNSGAPKSLTNLSFAAPAHWIRYEGDLLDVIGTADGTANGGVATAANVP